MLRRLSEACAAFVAALTGPRKRAPPKLKGVRLQEPYPPVIAKALGMIARALDTYLQLDPGMVSVDTPRACRRVITAADGSEVYEFSDNYSVRTAPIDIVRYGARLEAFGENVLAFSVGTETHVTIQCKLFACDWEDGVVRELVRCAVLAHPLVKLPDFKRESWQIRQLRAALLRIHRSDDDMTIHVVGHADTEEIPLLNKEEGRKVGSRPTTLRFRIDPESERVALWFG